MPPKLAKFIQNNFYLTCIKNFSIIPNVTFGIEGRAKAMALRKCPKCELNYIREGEEYCEVCKRAMKRALARIRPVIEETDEDEVIVCSECGEAPAARGGELCLACLKEKKRQVELENASVLPAQDDYDDEELLNDGEDLDGEEE